MKIREWLGRVLIPLLLIVTREAPADPVYAAVASNFSGAMNKIAAKFQEKTGHKVMMSYGATGKFYAQIQNGAPFDVFLAADDKHPARLEREGLAVTGSRFTYAVGTLVLWSPREDYVDGRGQVLR